ncbi:MAG: hypothetical protein HOV80_03665 [Polyangiaceae bacterium]|nr:hypothetical protein [Polyangiaceae bacterium]
MPLPRVQAFEVNDHPRAPAVLRDTIVESLSRTLRWGKILSGLVEPFGRFLDRAKATEVLDLGSGAGGPAAVLSTALAERGRDVRFLLTDLFPHTEVWERLKEQHPRSLDYVPEPVDATAIPPPIAAGRARAILNVLHHFPPDLARAVITSAIRDRAPLFIAEGFERTPLGFLPFAPAGLPAIALSPILSQERRLARALLAWATPVLLISSLWDGFVSTLRVYTEEELRAMTEGVPGADAYEWTYGTYRFPFGGRGYYFMGTIER